MSDDVRLEEVTENNRDLVTSARRQKLKEPPKKLSDDPDQPDFECDFHFYQMKRWTMLDALWNGTEGMRQAGMLMLPKYENEAQDVWQRRLDNAVLLNYFRKTVQGYVGKPFGKPLVVPEEMPDQLEEAMSDVDDLGTTFDLFAQTGFERAMCKGITHAFIDFPPAAEGETAADEAEKQPTVNIIEPENVIGAMHDSDGCLTMVRIREVTMESDGKFGETEAVRIRVLERDKWTLYKQNKATTVGGKNVWAVEADGKNTLGEIPFVTFYVDKEGFMRSRPPLMDLAFKNVEHWQSSSDQRNILSISRFPILVGSAVNPSDPLSIGPNNYFAFRDKDAKLMYCEPTGAAIDSGRQDLEDLKAEMGTLGLSLLLPAQPGSVTATAKAIDGAESITELQRIVMAYQTFLNEVIYWMARWQGMDDEAASALPQVTINEDYTKMLGLDAGMQALLSARSGKDISRATLLDAMKRRNLLPADFDADEDQDNLDDEAKKGGDGLPAAIGTKTGLFLSGGGKKSVPGASKDETPTDPTQVAGQEGGGKVASATKAGAKP